MNTDQRLSFFSPLNIASLLFIIIICHVTVQFNRNGGKGNISHEKLAQGIDDSFVKSARGQLPSRIGNGYMRFTDALFEGDCVIFKIAVPDTDVARLEENLRTNTEDILYYCTALQDTYTEWTKLTNKKTNRSRVLDAIIAGRYPVKFRFYHAVPEQYGEVNENRYIGELTATADQYIPKWKSRGLISKYYTAED